MSPLALYISVCRTILQENSALDRASCMDWEDCSRKLRRLRQLLLCRLCKNLCADPYSTENCQHLICKDCKGKKKSNVLGCRYCKSTTELSVDKQTSSVLQCYAKMCEVLYSYYTPGKTTIRSERVAKVLDIVTEGLGLAETIRSNALFTSKNWPSAASSSYSKLDDVNHVAQQNNVSKHGGSIQDGGTLQVLESHSELENAAGNPKDETISLSTCDIIKKVEPSDKLSVDDINDSNTNNLTNQAESCNTDLEKKLGFQSIRTEIEKMAKDDLPLANISLVADPLPNGDDSLVDHKPVMNGRVEQSFLHEKDVNRTLQASLRKRKLRHSTSSDDKKPSVSLRYKRRTSSRDIVENKSVSLQNKDEAPKSENGNTASEKEANTKDSITKGLSKMNGYDSKDTRQPYNNLNIKTKLFRKNKYKCMCGTSGLKYFTDVCKHGRCVCFEAEVPCVNCKCRFCSNPHKPRSDDIWTSFNRSVKSDEKKEDDGCGELEVVN